MGYIFAIPILFLISSIVYLMFFFKKPKIIGDGSINIDDKVFYYQMLKYPGSYGDWYVCEFYQDFIVIEKRFFWIKYTIKKIDILFDVRSYSDNTIIFEGWWGDRIREKIKNLNIDEIRDKRIQRIMNNE